MPTLPALTSRLFATTRSNWTWVCPDTTRASATPSSIGSTRSTVDSRTHDRSREQIKAVQMWNNVANCDFRLERDANVLSAFAQAGRDSYLAKMP